eukprot:COSAG04_NODE_17530_length_466_cov_1.264305_1_plen_39_part_10
MGALDGGAAQQYPATVGWNERRSASKVLKLTAQLPCGTE